MCNGLNFIQCVCVCVCVCRVEIPPRSGARRVMSIGMFPYAEVARGHDWLWGDQDGMYWHIRLS